MGKGSTPLSGHCYWVGKANHIQGSQGYQMCFLTAEFPQRCLLTRKFHSFRGPRLQSQGSGFGAWESWGTGGKLSISIRKLLRGGGVVVGNFLWFGFFVSWGFFFFFSVVCLLQDADQNSVSTDNFESPYSPFKRYIDTSLSFHEKFHLPDKPLFYQLLTEGAFPS